MSSNHYRLLAAGVVVVVVVVVLVYFQQIERDNYSHLSQTNLDIRANISYELNFLQKRHQQLICKLKNQSDISETGGWCGQAVKGRHTTDKQLVQGFVSLFTGNKVASFGDGPGEYGRLLLETGKIVSYDSFDGAPFIEEMTNYKVQFFDLSLPQYWLPRYDWVLCMEVIEHIPQKFESIVLDNLVRVAGKGIVLSWAVLGQAGYFHVNNQPQEHVDMVMMQRGLTRDVEWSLRLRSNASLFYLKNNLNVYRILKQ